MFLVVDMELLLTLVVFGFMVIMANGDWQRQEQSSKWEFQLARLSVDTQITNDALHADTVTGCAFHCSSTLGVDVWSLYFVPETGTCYCNTALDTNPEDANKNRIYYGIQKSLYRKEASGQHIRQIVWPSPEDCLTLYQAGYLEDGVYKITPKGGAATTTGCDMTNGGWTVIQTRKDGSEDFDRGWADYVDGFGNRTGEYWLGLENIHYLTKNGSDLQVHLEAFPGISPSSFNANYSSFTVDDGASKYVLHTSGFAGDTCGDSLAYHEGRAFTTKDNDNDAHTGGGNCANDYRGGWWFNTCHQVMLNGHYYQEGENVPTSMGIHWWHCWGHIYSAKSTTMKVRRHLLP